MSLIYLGYDFYCSKCHSDCTGSKADGLVEPIINNGIVGGFECPTCHDMWAIV